MISKVSKSSFNESNSIRHLQDELERNERIKTYFTENDKTPNTDGYFEILDKNRTPEKRFVVQIKSVEKLVELSNSNGEYSYSADCSFFHYVIENIDENPAFYFVVDLSKSEIFFKYLSLEYLLSLKIGMKKKVTMHLNNSDVLDEDSFYKICHDIIIKRRREYSRVFSSGSYHSRNDFDWYSNQTGKKGRMPEGNRVDETMARILGIPFYVRKRFHEIYYIGHGGVGEIYLLISDSPHRRLVLKQSKQKQSRAFDFKKEYIDYSAFGSHQYSPLLHEFYMLDIMRHPSIPRAIDYFEEENTENLLMDYVCGDNMKYYNAHGAFDLFELLTVMERICDVMIYMNSCNIIHGDIKPTNIIVGDNFEVSMIDYGISQFLDKRRTKCLGFTPIYTAPEVLLERTEGIKSIISEVYSLGATLLASILPDNTSIHDFETTKFGPGVAFYSDYKKYSERSLLSFFEEKLVCAGYGMHVLKKALDLNPQNRYATFSDMKDDILLWRKEEYINPSELNLALRTRKENRNNEVLTESEKSQFNLSKTITHSII